VSIRHFPTTLSPAEIKPTYAMTKTLSAIICCLCLLIGGGFSVTLASAAELDKIIAVVEDDVIMQSELDQLVGKARSEIRKRGSEPPPSYVLERQGMERLILQKIQVQLAARTGIKVTEDALDKAIKDIARKNNLSDDKFREILASEGYDFNVFREDIRQEILLSRLRREEVDKRVQVSDREVENYLTNQAGGASNDGEYQVSHILIAIPSGSTESEQRRSREKADQALERLNSGEPFRQVAVSMSDASDALDGGELGWRKLSEIPSLFADVVRNYQVDQTSGVITSSGGYHIVRLTGKRREDAVMLEQTHARHILINTSDDTRDSDAISRLRQLRDRIEGGEDFASVAKTHSDDRASALQGGDLGWVSKGQMVPEFEEVMTSSPIGELSQAFHSEFGWHILQVLERRKYDGTAEVKTAKAREAIMQRKREEAFQEWQHRLRDEAYVELRTAKD
jgi:peptidyl-prolyl cis-trans isomerase SurA